MRNKEELLLALLADHAERMPQPALPEEPRERILATAEAMRDGLAAWPWVVEVLVADDLVAASALRYGEHIVPHQFPTLATLGHQWATLTAGDT